MISLSDQIAALEAKSDTELLDELQASMELVEVIKEDQDTVKGILGVARLVLPKLGH